MECEGSAPIDRAEVTGGADQPPWPPPPNQPPPAYRSRTVRRGRDSLTVSWRSLKSLPLSAAIAASASFGLGHVDHPEAARMPGTRLDLDLRHGDGAERLEQARATPRTLHHNPGSRRRSSWREIGSSSGRTERSNPRLASRSVAVQIVCCGGLSHAGSGKAGQTGSRLASNIPSPCDARLGSGPGLSGRSRRERAAIPARPPLAAHRSGTIRSGCRHFARGHTLPGSSSALPGNSPD